MDVYQAPKTVNLIAENDHNPNLLQHCKIGFLSLIIGIILFFTILITLGWAGYKETVNPGAINSNESLATIIGLLIIGSGIGTVANTVLSIVSLNRKNYKHTYSIAGLTLNLVLVAISLLFISLATLITNS